MPAHTATTTTAPSAARQPDFAALHAAMRRWVDADFLSGISLAVASGGAPLHLHCEGFAERERGITLTTDHLFRVYSNSKLVTSCAVLLLLEEGRIALDDPAERFLPALAARRVLRRGARSIDDSEPARRRMTIAQLLCHTAGLSYGLLDPGTLLYQAYAAQRISTRETTLARMVDDLAPLPLAYEPGTGWEYSIATDVLARLVEVVSGTPFEHFVRERIFEPLAMRDTGFVVPERDHERLAAMYAGVDLMDPMKPGLRRGEHLMPPRSHLVAVPRVSGGGGLVSSLPDTMKLLCSLLLTPSGGADRGARALLRPGTIDLLQRNQLPLGQWVHFPVSGVWVGRGHGLASGLVVEPGPADHPGSLGEVFWGGMAGTQWWISPRHGFACALFSQRWWGFSHPLFVELKREAYRALLE